ncbi:MAG: DNA-binding protein [Deinococcus sp.]|jgi:hypothetical protein|nr:DNA-binding protein [Deinococcus sp.]
MTSKSSATPLPLVPVVVTVAAVGVAAGAALLARNRKAGEGGVSQQVKDLVVAQLLERPARNASYAGLGQALERGGMFLTGRAGRATDTPGNREVLAHIIGIERWGQNRLRVALGQRPMEQDDYSPYRPPADASLSELQDLLSQTRARSVDLARQLHAAAPNDDLKIEHNDFGPLTAKGWLQYLTQHADLESRKLKAGR